MLAFHRRQVCSGVLEHSLNVLNGHGISHCLLAADEGVFLNGLQERVNCTAEDRLCHHLGEKGRLAGIEIQFPLSNLRQRLFVGAVKN